jgi:hypothetical protein
MGDGVKLDGVHLAARETGAATFAELRIDGRQKATAHDGSRLRMAADGT